MNVAHAPTRAVSTSVDTCVGKSADTARVGACATFYRIAAT